MEFEDLRRASDGRSSGRRSRLAALIYGMWFAATYFWRALPPWPVLGRARRRRGRLAHEPAARDHPQPPDPLAPAQPRDRHLAAGALAAVRGLPHHPSAAPQRQPADRPAGGPRILLLHRRSNGRRCGRLGRVLSRAQSTLLGRLIARAGAGRWRGSGAARCKRDRARQLAPGRDPGAPSASRPRWCWPGSSASAACRSGCISGPSPMSGPRCADPLLRRASRGGRGRAAHGDRRRHSWLLGPLFLFNNLHVVHHMRASLPWYRTAALVSAQPRRRDRAQRRPRLPQLFRRRAALSVQAAPRARCIPPRRRPTARARFRCPAYQS